MTSNVLLVKGRRSIAEDIKQTRPFASDGQEATIALLRTADVVRRRLSRVVEREGTTLQQYNVLRILRGAPAPLSALEISERLIEETPGVSRLIDRLVAKKLVRRSRSSRDRRMLECSLTPQGLKLLERLDADVDAADAAPMATLAHDEVRRLTALLDRIRAADG
jgi:DNA-binding MarR family transcriptional regulator